MDIKHLEYFIEIVNSKCNMSTASKKLFVSQPALSSMITNFEREEGVKLFERYSGRLQNLTPSGEVFYEYAQQLVDNYYSMLHELRETSKKHKGKIKIGIPPFVLSVVFSQIIPTLILDNPDIEFTIVEQGAFDLKSLLVSKALDFAVLIAPADIDSGISDKYTIKESELSAFMAKENPLAIHDKIYWNQLGSQQLAIINDTFMSHHQIKEQLKRSNIHPKIPITSSCWDFLLLSTRNSNLITILPSLLRPLFNMPDIVERRFHEPIPWKVVLHQPKKNWYSMLEKHVLKSILEYARHL